MLRIYMLLSTVLFSCSVYAASEADLAAARPLSSAAAGAASAAGEEDPYAPYKSKVAGCADIQSVYALGLKFLRGQEEGFEKDSRATLTGAQFCFVHVVQALHKGTAVDVIDPKSGSLKLRTLHNLGITFRQLKDYKRAFQNLSEAARLGFEPSKAVLDGMEKAGQTPKSDRGDLAEAAELHMHAALMDATSSGLADMCEAFGRSMRAPLLRALRPDASEHEIGALVRAGEGTLESLVRDMRTDLREGTRSISDTVRAAAGTAAVSRRAAGDELCKGVAKLKADAPGITVIPDDALFTPGALDGVFHVARHIGARVTKDDAVIFVGRSPLWFLEAMNVSNLPGKRYAMPFSVGGIDLTSPDALAKYGLPIMVHYPAFLRSQGFDPSYWAKNPRGNIVLVDRVESGQSTLLFATILMRALGSEDASRIKILGLVNPGMRVSSMGDISISTIEIPQEALMHTYDKHGASQERSLGTPFHPVHWHRWKDAKFMEEVRGAPALGRLDQVHKYVSVVPAGTEAAAVGAGK